MTVYSHPRRLRWHRPHGNPWLAAALGLSAALIGLGAWVVVDRTTSSGATQGLASSDVVAMLRGRMAALNGGDAKAVAAFYTRDAVLEQRDVTPAAVTKGNDQIGEGIAVIVRTFGMQLQQTGPVIQLGTTVAEATRASAGGVPGFRDEGFILVYQLAADGRIAHQWVLPAPAP